MSSLTLAQLPDYCDRLEKECEKAKEKKESKIMFKLKNIKEIVDWREIRPNMSKDFVEANTPLTPSDHLPIASIESNLVNDLLICFLGGNAGYIKADPLTHKYSPRTFRISKELDVKLTDLTTRCLTMASHYSQLCRFIDDHRGLGAGRVNQSLASAMDIVMIDYKTFIVNLERIHLEKSMTLQMLWFHIQDVLRSLDVMCKLAMHIANHELRGSATLSYLHGESSYLLAPAFARDLVKFLTKKAAEPYMKSIEEWIFNGLIFDPFEEFMITERPQGALKDFNSPNYWDKRYSLQKERIPSFLECISTEILKSGAYLNVVRESALTIKLHKELKLAPVVEIKYSWRTSKYINVIHKAYKYSSSYLLTHMMEEYQLLDRFMFMRKYFLVQQGDFVAQVLETCDEELSKLIPDVIPSRLETLVDMAIRGVEGTVRDDLTIILQPQDLSKLSKIRVLATSEEHGHKKLGINKELTGFESFTLGMKYHWPVSIIFDARIISSYQMLFRLLFYCKYIERLLCRVWVIDQRLGKLPLQQSRQYSTAFALRQKMIYFIQNMQYYMMEEAIEPNWIEFQSQLKLIFRVPGRPESNTTHEERNITNSKVYSIDDLIDIHKMFLNKCMSDCLLTNATLFPIFQELLSICKNFGKFIIAQESEKTCNIIISDFTTFSSTICMFDKKFQNLYITFLKTIAQLAPTDNGVTKIYEILHRANFNNYFTSMMEEADVSTTATSSHSNSNI